MKFQTRKVIVAGGSFGTTKILLEIRTQEKVAGSGQIFSSHPQFMNFGLFDEPVNSHKGYFQTVASKDPNFRKSGFKLEIVFAPPVSIAMLFKEYGREHQEIMRNYTRINCVEVAVRDENVGEIRVNQQRQTGNRKTADRTRTKLAAMPVCKPFTTSCRRPERNGSSMRRCISDCT